MADPELLLQTSRFSVVRHVQITADGKTHERESVQHPGAVAILPFVTRDQICLIRNYRVAVGQTLLELPAGTRGDGEEPIVTAHRELLEETGYRAQSMERLAECLMSPGILNERMHLFVATGLTPGIQTLEPGEQIQALAISWEEAMRMVDDGRIADAKTLVGLLYYDRHRRRSTAGA